MKEQKMTITIKFDGYPPFKYLTYAHHMEQSDGIINLPSKGEPWDLEELKQEGLLADFIVEKCKIAANRLADKLPYKDNLLLDTAIESKKSPACECGYKKNQHRNYRNPC